MLDSGYLRAQADLRLEMAQQVSDRAASDNLRAEAARYRVEAAEIETGVKTSEAPMDKIAQANIDRFELLLDTETDATKPLLRTRSRRQRQSASAFREAGRKAGA